MTDDITPGLLKKIQDDFQKNFDKSAVISNLYKKVRDGTATYKEANEFAIEIGDILAGAFKRNLSSNVLPNGRMYYNIAQRIIEPTMKNNYDLITDVTNQVQTSLNKASKIGIKAIKPELNQDRIHGIMNKVADAEVYDDVAWVLDEPIVNFSQSIVDDSIKANAEFQYGSGMSPKIVRTSTGKCCDWCNEIVGVYDYEKVRDTGNKVFRRHRFCRCMVEYDPGTGRVVDVHTKKESDKNNRDQRIKNSRAYEERRKNAENSKREKRKQIDSKSNLLYNTPPIKELKKIYMEDVDEGWISSLCSFEEYVLLYKKIQSEIVGKHTVNNILITGQSRHFLQRVIGTAVDPKIYKNEHKKIARSGVEIEDIIETLFHGIPRSPQENGGDMSQLFIGKHCNVSVNPITGKLIQCNPNRR